MIQAAAVELAPLESERFGIAVARTAHISRENLHEVLRFCRDHQVAMLIARVPAAELATVQALESEGFQLMDTLVRYEIELNSPKLTPAGTLIRPMEPGEDEDVIRIARESFARYFGHYHADPRLDRAACDEVYVSWARRCCAWTGPSEVVLVAEVGGRVGGFAAIRVMDEAGELWLGAVAPEARGRSLYRALSEAGMAWAQGRGARRFHADTQLQNYRAQRAWAGAGLTLGSAAHTLHKWFDRERAGRP